MKACIGWVMYICCCIVAGGIIGTGIQVVRDKECRDILFEDILGMTDTHELAVVPAKAAAPAAEPAPHPAAHPAVPAPAAAKSAVTAAVTGAKSAVTAAFTAAKSAATQAALTAVKPAAASVATPAPSAVPSFCPIQKVEVTINGERKNCTFHYDKKLEQFTLDLWHDHFAPIHKKNIPIYCGYVYDENPTTIAMTYKYAHDYAYVIAIQNIANKQYAHAEYVKQHLSRDDKAVVEVLLHELAHIAVFMYRGDNKLQCDGHDDPVFRSYVAYFAALGYDIESNARGGHSAIIQ